MTSDYIAPKPSASSRSGRPAVRVVAVLDGQANAEDLALDHAQAAERFGADVAALIFDDQRPGALDVTHRTAALRYGAPAAALIFPAAAGAHTPDVTDNDGEGDGPALALPLVERVVS